MTHVASFVRCKRSGLYVPGSPTATQLVITTQPSSTATSGAAFAQQPVVQVRDSGNSLVTGSTASVTATITTGTGTLVGTATVNAVAGVATFTNLGITGTGSFNLTFSSSGLTSATSSASVVSGSSFAAPDVVDFDASGTTIQNTQGIPGRNWDTDTPGHTPSTLIPNPTGDKPWNLPGNNVAVTTYDPSADSNSGILVDPSQWELFDYGTTMYVAWWEYIDASAVIGSFLRKWMYARWNSVSGGTGSPDHVLMGFGAGLYGNTAGPGGNINWVDSGAPPFTPPNVITKGAWMWFEVKTVFDSQPGGASTGGTDGSVTVWFNDETTPLFTHVIRMSGASSPAGSANRCNWLRIGAQLESGSASETRYIGPAAVSTQPIGKR